jgi:predicted esterase
VERLARALIESGLMSRLRDYGYEAHGIPRESEQALAKAWSPAILARLSRESDR